MVRETQEKSMVHSGGASQLHHWPRQSWTLLLQMEQPCVALKVCKERSSRILSCERALEASTERGDSSATSGGYLKHVGPTKATPLF